MYVGRSSITAGDRKGNVVWLGGGGGVDGGGGGGVDGGGGGGVIAH